MLRDRRYWAGLVAMTALPALFLIPVTPITAGVEIQAPPSPEKGHTLAQKFCTNCHVIDDTSNTTVPAGVPAFRGIANKPGQTGQNIMNVLIQPHAPMPDLHLTRDEIIDIIAYLETLRTNEAVAPLLVPTAPAPKTLAPEHS
jgi:cytochrome c